MQVINMKGPHQPKGPLTSTKTVQEDKFSVIFTNKAVKIDLNIYEPSSPS